MSNKVLIFDPSYGTLNMGDNIIVEACLKQLNYYIKDKFNIRVSSHQPLTHFHQVIGNNIYKKQISEVDNTFVLGSNLLNKDIFITRKRPWNIHFWTSKGIHDAILVGVGSNGKGGRNTAYTRKLYRKVLSDKYYHSVRDQETYDYVTSIGLKAINTGCATMWELTPEHCKNIPNVKSDNVVFTLTDYAEDIALDTFQINTLIKEYEKIYFWPQGSEDREYFQRLDIDHQRVISLNSDLDSYRDILSKGNIDYVGSRLHGGIFALQHGVRTIIVAVDHRAMNKQKDYNLPAIDRNTAREELVNKIHSEFKTEIKLNFKEIERWKAQFK